MREGVGTSHSFQDELQGRYEGVDGKSSPPGSGRVGLVEVTNDKSTGTDTDRLSALVTFAFTEAVPVHIRVHNYFSLYLPDTNCVCSLC